jgi:hypothetical protein
LNYKPTLSVQSWRETASGGDANKKGWIPLVQAIVEPDRLPKNKTHTWSIINITCSIILYKDYVNPCPKLSCSTSSSNVHANTSFPPSPLPHSSSCHHPSPRIVKPSAFKCVMMFIETANNHYQHHQKWKSRSLLSMGTLVQYNITLNVTINTFKYHNLHVVLSFL